MIKKSPWEIYKENNKNLKENRPVRPWDILSPNTSYVDEHVLDERLSICQACPELIKLTSQCKKCGCFMKIKAKILDAKCPLSKW